jgi:catechol 2,3-dioxygenase-like lactoylglutathione lyase family enzyme
MTPIWYRVADLDVARAFYVEKLGFEEAYFDEKGRWIRLVRDEVQIAVAEDESGEESEVVAAIQVGDLKAEADRLREAGVEVGVVLEIHGTLRLVDIYDPDGNRLQLVEDL